MGLARTPRAAAALLACAVLAAACSDTRAAPEVPAELRAVVDALRDGGHVVFLRHAATDTTVPSAAEDPDAGCAAQRNLSQRGRQDAAALGDALRALHIPVSEVVASPLCRTLDTARLAFGDAVADERLLPPTGARVPAGGDLQGMWDAPAAGNRVLVGHAATIADLIDVHLDEGEAAVLRPAADGVPRLVGRLSTEALGVSPGGG